MLHSDTTIIVHPTCRNSMFFTGNKGKYNGLFICMYFGHGAIQKIPLFSQNLRICRMLKVKIFYTVDKRKKREFRKS